MICMHEALLLEMASISTALMMDESGMRRMAEYSCGIYVSRKEKGASRNIVRGMAGK